MNLLSTIDCLLQVFVDDCSINKKNKTNLISLMTSIGLNNTPGPPYVYGEDGFVGFIFSCFEATPFMGFTVVIVLANF